MRLSFPREREPISSHVTHRGLERVNMLRVRNLGKKKVVCFIQGNIR